MGRGGATTFSMDMQHADAVMIMGSNMAECHPVAFRWVLQAKGKGAKIIHVDPRFTRTSAMASIYSPVRAGSDIVYLGALVSYVINSRRWNQEPFFKEYVVNYTNAATLINPDYKGPEELDGLFSGFDPNTRSYSTKTWSYQTEEATPSIAPEDAKTFAEVVAARVPGQPKQDPTLQDPQTVFQIM
jgi:formate dehydrogenase major subunit